MVQADTLSAEAILDGLRRGDFYSSTGVALQDYDASGREIRVGRRAWTQPFRPAR